MAAVTINPAPPLQGPFRHVIGDLTMRVFNISGASGSTLDTGLKQILYVDYQRSTSAGATTQITQFTIGTGANSSVITFTSSGTMANEVVIVFGRVG